MSYNYDAQLIDSVRLGHARIEGALLFGEDRLKRQFRRRVGTFLVGFFLAVLGCAGCVIAGWVISLLADMQARNAPPPPTPSPSVEAHGASVLPRPIPTLSDPASIPPEEAVR